MAVTTGEARKLALALPEAVEQDHHGRPSFRVGGRIFATLWDEDRINVMVDEDGIRTALERAPETCEPVWWGKRLAAVGVTLSVVERAFLAELLADAWEGKAPRRLLRSLTRPGTCDSGRAKGEAHGPGGETSAGPRARTRAG